MIKNRSIEEEDSIWIEVIICNSWWNHHKSMNVNTQSKQFW